MAITTLQYSVYTTVKHIQDFVKAYYKKGSASATGNPYERGYYSALLNILEASPTIWQLLDEDTRNALIDVKSQLKKHFNVGDSEWPPKNRQKTPA